MDEAKTIKKNKKTQEHAFKNHEHTYNVKILKSINPELQLKNAEFAVKNELENNKKFQETGYSKHNYQRN